MTDREPTGLQRELAQKFRPQAEELLQQRKKVRPIFIPFDDEGKAIETLMFPQGSSEQMRVALQLAAIKWRDMNVRAVVVMTEALIIDDDLVKGELAEEVINDIEQWVEKNGSIAGHPLAIEVLVVIIHERGHHDFVSRAKFLRKEDDKIILDKWVEFVPAESVGEIGELLNGPDQEPPPLPQ